MGFLTRKDPTSDLRRQVDNNPKDTRGALDLAGQLEKKGDRAGAIDYYLRAARAFAADAIPQKASAAAKRALIVDPKSIEAHEFLADLYENVKLKEDARGILKKLIDLYFDSRDTEKVAQTRERLNKLGPGR